MEPTDEPTAPKAPPVRSKSAVSYDGVRRVRAVADDAFVDEPDDGRDDRPVERREEDPGEVRVRLVVDMRASLAREHHL